jgi:hypothetical protein
MTSYGDRHGSFRCAIKTLIQCNTLLKVSGSKLWTLCDPEVNIGRLYNAGDVNTFDPDLAAFVTMLCAVLALRVKHSLFYRFPRFAQSSCYEDTIRKGEIIFYPKDYWHQTRNLETPTISVSGTIVDATNKDTVQQELEATCKFNKWKWNFSHDLCTALERCYELWSDFTSATGAGSHDEL